MIWPLDLKSNMTEIIKISGLLLFSALKFFLAPAAVLLSGYDLIATILITSFGGVGGFVIFYLFGSFFYRQYIRVFPPNRKRVFSSRRRRMVRYKGKYGFWGLAVLTPVLFGIPLGALIAAAFFQERMRTISVFVSSIVIWSILISLQCFYLKEVW